MTPVEIDAAGNLSARTNELRTAASEGCARAQKLAAKTDALVAATESAITSSKAVLERSATKYG
jgi:hypothetical protein